MTIQSDVARYIASARCRIDILILISPFPDEVFLGFMQILIEHFVYISSEYLDHVELRSVYLLFTSCKV